MSKLVLHVGRALAILCLCAGAVRALANDAVRDRTVGTVLVHANRPASAEFAVALDQSIPAAAPYLYEMLSAGGIPSEWGVPDGAFFGLDAPHLAELRGALARMPGGSLRSMLQAIALEEPRMRYRATGVDLLGDVGRADDIRLMLQLAAPLKLGAEILPRAYRKRLELALVQVLGRDARGLTRIEHSARKTHIGLRATLVDAVGAFPGELGLATLASMLSMTQGLDGYILTAIARIAGDVPLPVDGRIHADVRAFLYHGDPTIVRTATRAVGLLEDFDALPILIERLGDPDNPDHLRIHRALQDLTGLGLRADGPSWSAWFDDEQRWWDEEVDDLQLDLRLGKSSAAMLAIGSIAGRRLERHNLVAVLEHGLDRPEPAVAKMTCLALAELGSGTSVPVLIDTLEHREETVRDAAWKALKAVTGESLPADADLWRAFSLQESQVRR